MFDLVKWQPFRQKVGQPFHGLVLMSADTREEVEEYQQRCHPKDNELKIEERK